MVAGFRGSETGIDGSKDSEMVGNTDLVCVDIDAVEDGERVGEFV